MDTTTETGQTAAHRVLARCRNQMARTSAENVVRRYLAFKYQPKETKKHKVEKLTDQLRKLTGISKSLAADVANAAIRGRDLASLALQKGWPVDERNNIVGPQGKAPLDGLLATV